MRSARQKLQQQRKEAQQWANNHRMLWSETPLGFESLDDILAMEGESELWVCESDPGYEDDVDLLDIMKCPDPTAIESERETIQSFNPFQLIK